MLWDPIPFPGVDGWKVLSRGGWTCVNEDFELFACPNCRRVYLYESEIGTIFVDGTDLCRRASDFERFQCVECNHESGISEPPFGPRTQNSPVTWDELESSAWTWVATRP